MRNDSTRAPDAVFGGGGVYAAATAGIPGKLLTGARDRESAGASADGSEAVAGRRSAAYRSSDEGATWERITPVNHSDLRNLIRWPSIRRIPTSSMLELITCLGRPRMAAKTGFRW